jgi:hypothetical protein
MGFKLIRRYAYIYIYENHCYHSFLNFMMQLFFFFLKHTFLGLLAFLFIA